MAWAEQPQTLKSLIITYKIILLVLLYFIPFVRLSLILDFREEVEVVARDDWFGTAPLAKNKQKTF